LRGLRLKGLRLLHRVGWSDPPTSHRVNGFVSIFVQCDRSGCCRLPESRSDGDRNYRDECPGGLMPTDEQTRLPSNGYNAAFSRRLALPFVFPSFDLRQGRIGIDLTRDVAIKHNRRRNPTGSEASGSQQRNLSIFCGFA